MTFEDFGGAVGWLVDLRGPGWPARLRPTHLVLGAEWQLDAVTLTVTALNTRTGAIEEHAVKLPHLRRRRVG